MTLMQAQTSPGFHIDWPTVDWSKLVPDIVTYFLNAVSDTIANGLLQLWDGFWQSGANVIGQTPEKLTVSFGPVQFYMSEMEKVAGGVALLALVLLGLSVTLGLGHGAQAGVLAIVKALVLSSTLWVLLHRAYVVLNAAATAIGRADLHALIPQSAEHHVFSSFVLLLILLWMAVELVFLSVERIVTLAILTPFGPLLMLAGAIPQTSWLPGWWARTYFGLLFVQLPVVMVLTIGVQMAIGGGGIATWVIAIACMRLAKRLLTMFYDGMHIGLGSGGGGMRLYGAPRGGGGATGGGASGSGPSVAQVNAGQAALPAGSGLAEYGY